LKLRKPKITDDENRVPVPVPHELSPDIEMEPAAAENMLNAILQELSARSTNPDDPACPITETGDEKKVHNDLVEATYHYVKAILCSSGRAFDKAREDYARAHIKVGKVLHEIFFNSTLELKEVEGLHPYKARARSWKSLMAKTDDFLKPSAVRNLLRCAVQDKWFEEEKVDTTALKYTHLVLLSRLDNNDTKKELIGKIQQEGWSVRALQENLPDRPGETPPTLGESLTATAKWIKQVNNDNFLEDITTIHELSPKLAVERLDQVNSLIKNLDFALERLRHYKKELKAATTKTINPY
jgi:hypothetical protein